MIETGENLKMPEVADCEPVDSLPTSWEETSLRLGTKSLYTDLPLFRNGPRDPDPGLTGPTVVQETVRLTRLELKPDARRALIEAHSPTIGTIASIAIDSARLRQDLGVLSVTPDNLRPPKGLELDLALRQSPRATIITWRLPSVRR